LLLAELQLTLGLPEEAATSAAEAAAHLAKLKDEVSVHVKRARLIEASARSQSQDKAEWAKADKLAKEVMLLPQHP